MSFISIDKKGVASVSQEEERPLLRCPVKKRIFVVQRHLGSVLHYDLRIEIGGVLKSWAVPKGPSMNTGDRRLAVMAKDYPLGYASFRGVVPEGTYGAGIVEMWDKGEFIAHSYASGQCTDDDVLSLLEGGRLRFTLKGKKLKGVFMLVRMGESGNWMLIKGNDKFAVNFPYTCEDYINGNSPINRVLKKTNGHQVPFYSPGVFD